MDRAVLKKQHPGWLKEMEHEGKLDYSSVDRDKLRAGVSVIQQISLFSPDDPCEEIASCTQANCALTGGE